VNNPPAYNTENEYKLLQLIAQNDGVAFKSVFDHYWDRIYSMALTYLKSPLFAEDAVQEVFVKLWNNRQQLPGVRKFDSYLFIIARNEIISTLRKKVVHTPFDQYLSNELTEEALLPDQQLNFKEFQTLIDDAIGKLPSQQQRVYRMSRQEGMSQEQIAHELDISISTIKGHMTKALQSIRTQLSMKSDKATLLWWLILIAIKK
jgi:RNA polymerase sigma-70 factor (ECF subfamily)